MSDYLNNLVARTLGLAPVVQPRLGSLFEPVSASTPEVSSTSIAGQTSDEVSLPRPTPPRADVQIGGIERKETNSDGPAQDHSALVAAPVVVSGPSPPGVNRGNFESSPAPEIPSVNPSGAATDHQSLPQPIVRPRIDRVAVNEQVNTTSPEPVETPLMVRPRESTTFAPALRQDSPVLPAHRLHAERPAAEGPQTISVTIGRVDVRAVFSPPPAPKVNHSQTRPAMSLDEYLKQRNEGRR